MKFLVIYILFFLFMGTAFGFLFLLNRNLRMRDEILTLKNKLFKAERNV